MQVENVNDSRLAILVSGRGSNMLAIAQACENGTLAARIDLVISNVPDAPALPVAAAHGIETLVLEPGQSPDRESHDRRMASACAQRGVGLVCLAGYMRLLSPAFISRFPGRIMNIHPALLPAFPGLHAQRQAVEYGVRVSGVTVHFVDEQLDAGPIILQRMVLVEPEDTEETLAARLLTQEHAIYPEAIKLFFQGRLRIEGRRVRITGR